MVTSPAITDTRRSSRQKDTMVSPVETAVQLRPLRSSSESSCLKAVEVRPVPPSHLAEMMATRHYLRSMPAAPRCCFGIYVGDVLMGGAVFTSGPRNAFKYLTAAKSQDVSVLARLWLHDDLPANSESRVLGIILRHLQKHTDWKFLLSYADPEAGHVGTIYQATGWLYLGVTERNTYLRLADGSLHHRRSLYDSHGSNSVRHLRATGVSVEECQAEGKHRYGLILCPSWHWRLRLTPLPYPRKAQEANYGG